MFHPFLAAGEAAPSFQWLSFVQGLGIALITALGALALALFNNRHQRQAKHEEGNANVEIASIRSLGDVQARLQSLNDNLQSQIRKVQDRADGQIKKLDRKLQLMSTAYHALWAKHKAREQNWRTLTVRLKNTPFQIDPTEFIEDDKDDLSPIKLLEMMDKIDQEVSVTIFPSPTDPAKTLTITDHGDGNVDVK